MKIYLLILLSTLAITSCVGTASDQVNIPKNILNYHANSAPLPELHKAVLSGSETAVIELLDAGADINQLDPTMGNSPLHLAAQGDNPSMVALLINRGAFVNLRTPHAGHTPLMVAAWYSKPENIKELLKAEDINLFATTPSGVTAQKMVGGFDKNLTEDEKRRYAALTEIFEDYEAELTQKMENQAIYQAVTNPSLTEKEKYAQVESLIKMGHPVNTQSYVTGSGNDQHSPLLVAARNNYPSIVKLLLEKGADIGQRGYLMNAIAFHKAGYMGNSEIMKMLVNHPDAQKYINDQGLNNGYTPLHDAIWHGNTEAAKILIDAGARLDLTTYEGDTPLDLANRYNYTDIAGYIVQKTNQ